MRSLPGVQQQLGPAMMLLVQVPAVWRTGTWGTSWLLVTGGAAHTQFVDSKIPFGDLSVEVAGRTMHSSPDCAAVVDLRAGIQEDPGPDVAIDDVLRQLDGRPARRPLDAARRAAARRIQPPGCRAARPRALRAVAPARHRRPAPGAAMRGERAAQPRAAPARHLHRLCHDDAAQEPARELRAELPDGELRRYGRLPNGEDEAAKIADILGVTPVLEEDATAEAVIEALENARYVHVSAHGRHNTDAAAFQGIQLAGTPARLTAHRLSALDLRGLRLVTLSACETALGRFDRADNLRGIPAALFLAGVRSIVGTLWDARASAAEVFFVALYQQLVTGRASIASAYRTAQAQTRQAFPAYRDWGAFVLMGGLPEVYTSRGTQ